MVEHCLHRHGIHQATIFIIPKSQQSQIDMGQNILIFMSMTWKRKKKNALPGINGHIILFLFLVTVHWHFYHPMMEVRIFTI